MADPPDDQPDDQPDGQHEDAPLNERLLDLLIFVPAGIAVSVVEELPKLAARGRDRLGVRVSSARAVGEFAVKAGQHQLRRRSQGLWHRDPVRSDGPSGDERRGSPDGKDKARSAPPAGPVEPRVRLAPPPGGGHVPLVSALAIPGFDTLSASQVVQRLDGLTRAELVSVRTYESSTRGRRTILSRVDQLLDERS
jgi:hypothetical protein